jgi:DNA-binding XRE family transcriptional regulator
MKLHPQTIYRNKQPEFVILPFKEYKQLISSLEDFKDVQEIKEHSEKQSETFPVDIVLALSKGKNPIKVYREYRGLSQVSLAKKVRISKQYISQLESGERDGTTRVLKSISKVLDIDLEDIT